MELPIIHQYFHGYALSTFGCDGIVTTYVKVNQSISTSDTMMVCDSVLWNGKWLTLVVYVDTFLTDQGCDSISCYC